MDNDGGKENGVQNGGVSIDDTFVNELIDFSKLEELYGICSENEDDRVSFEVETMSFDDSPSPPPPPRTVAEEINLPAYDVACLEWLSTFVDDSSHRYSLTMAPVDSVPVKSDPKPNPNEDCIVNFSGFGKRARSRRVRKSAGVWSLNDSASSSSSSSLSYQPNELALYNEAGQSAEKPLFKKQKLKQELLPGGEPRRCSHCRVQKTPQWRAGPMGPKTLCNACGVRFKTGRLLPEYRPAMSPTFSSDKHSNNHRKVLEMRKKKVDGESVMPG